MDFNPSHHALLTMISRSLSGEWLIEPNWLFQNADLLMRGEGGQDMSAHWPRMQGQVMISSGSDFSAAAQGDTIGKGQALGVINIVGPIYKYYYNGSKTLTQLLNMMAADDRIGGVKLIVDSPGGMLHGTREVFQTIKAFPKPVLAAIDGYAASAAYYQIGGASRIVATQPSDQIGSIGTFVTVADWNAYYKSMGLDIHQVYAAASSEKNEDFRQLLDSKGKDQQLLQKTLTTYNDQFIADMKDGRGDRLTGKGQYPFKGRIFFPDDSIENGLIDELISEGETLSLLGDMIATNTKSSIQMKNPIADFFSGLKTLISTAEKDAGLTGEQPTGTEQPSVEQLQATINQLKTERDSATQELTTLKTEKETLASEKATLVTEKSTLEAKVAELGEQPGAMGTQSKKKDSDDLNDNQGNDWLSKVAGLEHNQAADQLFS